MQRVIKQVFENKSTNQSNNLIQIKRGINKTGPLFWAQDKPGSVIYKSGSFGTEVTASNRGSSWGTRGHTWAHLLIGCQVNKTGSLTPGVTWAHPVTCYPLGISKLIGSGGLFSWQLCTSVLGTHRNEQKREKNARGHSEIHGRQTAIRCATNKSTE